MRFRNKGIQCSHEKCSEDAFSKGLCRSHYRQLPHVINKAKERVKKREKELEENHDSQNLHYR